MPKTIYIPEDAKYSGIDVTYTKSKRCLDIGGWYDSFVGIESKRITLSDLFLKLGITEGDCKKAFKEMKEDK